MFFQITPPPTEIVTALGLKAKSAILTRAGAARPLKSEGVIDWARAVADGSTNTRSAKKDDRIGDLIENSFQMGSPLAPADSE
jgi:hypothetical protein